MKRATITIPDELQEALDEYVRRQETPPPLGSVMQTALRQFLEWQERFEGDEVRPFRITPARNGSGLADVSVNHDAYLAEDSYEDSFGET